MAQDPALRDHQEWINYLQPEGLVVSARALVEAQVVLDNATLRELQERFRGVVIDDADPEQPRLRSELAAIVRDFLQWPVELIDGWGGKEVPAELVYVNADLGVRLVPTFALRAKEPKESDPRHLLLVQALGPDERLDIETEVDGSSWKTTPSRRFERLLRETKVPIGLIADATSARLIYAPPQENTGILTFPLAAMFEIAGRKILGGFHALLSRERLFTGPRESRLPALLEKSRKSQAAVSTALSEQVLESLYELVRGFQAADSRTNGDLLREVLANRPDHIYQGLLNVLLRLITLLYAEDRGLLPQSDLFVRNYSLRGLYERLRADAERNPDTMDHRYGAWHQLLVLFRLVYTGCRHPLLEMPARHGGLFDPERFGFLEGRTLAEPALPLVPDRTVHRVLDNLLVVDGERLSYRWLDVEHIGSVYETMMGFRMERAIGPSIALKATKKGGAPTTIDLAALLEVVPAKRAAWVKEHADQKIDGKALEAMKAATTIEGLRAALDRKVAHTATPDIVAQGSMVLQPSDERRKSGSHYTPRSLTGPIVQKTLEPILARLGVDATADQILDLRVCDPAMGSGAFLVEACRQLAKRVQEAWVRHRFVPVLPPDEDLDLYAMRMVAQRCLYGVDKNPAAVDLAKLSLWLATFARKHAFTFLDHALKCGDSLVGLSREQFEAFHWDGTKPAAFVSAPIAKRVRESLELRDQIRGSPDGLDQDELRRLLAAAQQATTDLRLVGDLVVAVYFSADSDKKREAARHVVEDDVRHCLESGTGADALRPHVATLWSEGATPFHWWLEFPEVFVRSNGGFDAIVGNPPFAGKNTVSEGTHARFPAWLKELHEESHGNADLVAHFFRRAFNLLREGGTFGLIATKTIRQGDTRSTGLRWICKHGGEIYSARTRVRWPGVAAVVISVVHVHRGPWSQTRDLDCRNVEFISAYLFHAGDHDDPLPLLANAGKSFQGSNVLGMGFTFDDSDRKGVASPIADMHRLIAKDSRNAECIFPYIGGEEVNDSPVHAHDRFVINFGEMLEAEARRWPDLMQVIEERVKPERDKNNRDMRRVYWWRFGETTPALYAAIAGTRRVTVIAQTSNTLAFAFLSPTHVFGHTLVVMPLQSWSSFAVLQSRPHEAWARFFAAQMKDDARYLPSDCFETFPFPLDFETHIALDAAGKAYYEFRAELMVRNNEGLTKTYNRFHSDDPRLVTPDIVKLRELHAAMDRAVLDAYPELRDLHPTCEFIPDYFEADGDCTEVPKSIRYRWPDETRDEVLARLLALNKKRYDEEVRLGLHAKPKSKGARRRKQVADEAVLFDNEREG